MNKHPILLFLSIPLSLILVATAALAILPSLRAQAGPSFAAAARADAYIQDSAVDPTVSGLSIVAAVAATELPQPIISLPANNVLAALNSRPTSAGYSLVRDLDTDSDQVAPHRARFARTVVYLIPSMPQQTIHVVYVVDGPHHLCTIKTRL
jgi:hypothetical protein